jgi:hypothetical protein
MAKLKATLHKVQMDKEGEFKVILTVPMIYRENCLAVQMMTEKVLDVEIKEEEIK